MGSRRRQVLTSRGHEMLKYSHSCAAEAGKIDLMTHEAMRSYSHSWEAGVGKIGTQEAME